MRKIAFTSGAFTGEVVLIFNDDDYLVSYDALNATLSREQQAWFLQRLPQTYEEVNRVLSGSPTAKLTDISVDVSFDMFWNRYDEKIRSSKKITMARWNKLSQVNRNKAYWYIPRYFGSILQGVAKKNAETYLNQELWNN